MLGVGYGVSLSYSSIFFAIVGFLTIVTITYVSIFYVIRWFLQWMIDMLY